MNTFYDIHVHALNLNHPNLSAFLFRDKLIDNLIEDKFGLLTRFGIFFGAPLVSFAPKKTLIKQINKLLTSGSPSLKDTLENCLSFFEIPLEYQFLVLEHFLKMGQPKVLNEKNQIAVNGTVYDKMLLCPLVMDFGYKNIAKGVYYNLTPKRPIANQIGDLLYAIRTYYRFNLSIEDKKMKLSKEIPDFESHKAEKLFEIYPFMGIDTRNYSLQEVEKLLNKYFGNFSKTEAGEVRRKRLFEKMGKLDSNMYAVDRDYSDVFAGIKLYPQLGFDPYPSNKEELEKVDCLYQFCIDKRVPITTHCSDGGFKVGNYDALTSPLGKWDKVLAKYPQLTLNFAHFGSESQSDKRQWRNAIVNLIKEENNIYADISCHEMNASYYEELEYLLGSSSKVKMKNLPEKHNPNLYKRVLFGSDFSINLLAAKATSYGEYLNDFIKANISHKNDLCEYNPQRFLFGE